MASAFLKEWQHQSVYRTGMSPLSQRWAIKMKLVFAILWAATDQIWYHISRKFWTPKFLKFPSSHYCKYATFQWICVKEKVWEEYVQWQPPLRISVWYMNDSSPYVPSQDALVHDKLFSNTWCVAPHPNMEDSRRSNLHRCPVVVWHTSAAPSWEKLMFPERPLILPVGCQCSKRSADHVDTRHKSCLSEVISFLVWVLDRYKGIRWDQSVCRLT